MGRLFLGVVIGEPRSHRLERARFAPPAFVGVDLRTARRHLPTTVGEVALGRDPVVIEGSVVVLEERDRHLGAVAGTDDRLVGFLGQASGRVQSVDAGAAPLIGVDERLAAVDDADARDAVEVVSLVFRRGDDVLGVESVAVLGFDREAVVGRRDARDRPPTPFAAGLLGALAHQLQQEAGVDAGRKAGDVLEVGVPPEDGVARVDDERLQPVSRGEGGRREAGDPAADDDDVDVAVVFEDLEPGDPRYTDVLFGLGADLAIALGTDDVDVVDLRRASPALVRVAFADGTVLVGDDRDVRELRERLLASADEDESRSPAERFDDVLASIDDHLA